MKKDSIKRLNFAFAILPLVLGCLTLITATVVIYSLLLNILEGDIKLIKFCAIVCAVISIVMFYIAINSFIKYGITLGIDYALDKQKETIEQMTMEKSKS